MAKLTTDPIANLNVTTVAVLNNNFEKVEVAMENTLSRDGATPNQMESDLDMNNNDILNVDHIDVESITVDGVPIGDVFDDIADAVYRYLGAFRSSNIPTTRANGTAMRIGDWYFNLDSGISYVWDGVSFVDADFPELGHASSGSVYATRFGMLPTSDPANPVYVDTEFRNAYEFARDNGFGEVIIGPGMHCLQEEHVIPREVKIRGVGPQPNVRDLVYGSVYADLVDSPYTTVLLACGTGPRTNSIYYVTEGRQQGYVHANANRLYTNTADAEFTMDDYTNQDAVGNTPATPRLFSTFIRCEENMLRAMFENLKIVPSCPDPDLGEVEGVSGYKRTDVVLPWADWDIGLFVSNPWGIVLRDVNIVGYWGMKAHLSYGAFVDRDHNPSVGGTPSGEHGEYNHCQFQSGVAFRTGDTMPVIDKTSDHIYIRWFRSHQIRPTGGYLGRIGNESDSFGGLQYDYSGTTWVANTPNSMPDTMGGGFLRIENVRPTGTGSNDTSAINTEFTNPGLSGSITPTFAGGHSHTRMIDCRLTDFGHATGVDEANDIFRASGIPARNKYSCALEMSGAPMRAMKFSNTMFTTVGPVVMHIGAARDTLWEGDCYAETRPYKTSLASSTLDGVRGGVILAGPNTTYASETGNAGAFWGTYFGLGFNDVVSMHPVRNTRAGTRMVNQLNHFTHRGYNDFDLMFPRSTTDMIISTPNARPLRISRRDASGNSKINIYARTVSGSDRLELMDNTIHIQEDTLMRPGADNLIGDGSPSFRWSTNYTVNLRPGTGTALWTVRTGTPVGSFTANLGSLAADDAGTPGNILFVKENASGTTGWAEVRDFTGTATDTQIADITAAVNTTGKRTGKVVWDTVNNRAMRARGSTAGAVWDVIDGSASVTPV